MREMELVTQAQTLYEANGVSLHTNALGKDMVPNLPPIMGKF